MSDPVVTQLSPASLFISWSSVPNARTYTLERFYDEDQVWEIVASTFKETSLVLVIDQEDSFRFRVAANDGNPNRAYSCETIFTSKVEESLALFAPKITEVSSQILSFTWDAFGDESFSYELQVFQKGDWEVQAVIGASGGSTEKYLAPKLVALDYGTPQFYKIVRGEIESASTIFSMSSVLSASGFDPSAVVVEEFSPVNATSFSAPLFQATGHEESTMLGGIENAITLVRYNIPQPFDECKFLYAKLRWTSEYLAGIDHLALNGAFIRVYSDITSWTETSLVPPSITETSSYLSNTQITINEHENTLEVPLDRMVSTNSKFIETLDQWAKGEENNGLMIRLETPGAPASLLLDVLPKLIVALEPLEYSTTKRTGAVAVESAAGIGCQLCDSPAALCNSDAEWNSKIPLSEFGIAIPEDEILYQVNVTILGSFEVLQQERFSLGLGDALIVDLIFTEVSDSIQCYNTCTSHTFTSPIYPPQSSSNGWPAFDNSDMLFLFYSGKLCASEITVTTESYKDLANQFCAPSTTSTPTPTPAISFSPRSISPPISLTPSPTPSVTVSDSSSVSQSSSISMSATASKSSGASDSPSNTRTPSISVSESPSPSSSISESSSASASSAESPTPSISITSSSSPSASVTPSRSISQSPSSSQSQSFSSSASLSFSATSSESESPSSSISESPTVSNSATSSPSMTGSRSSSPSITPTKTSSISLSPSHSSSASNSASTVPTKSPSHTSSKSGTASTSREVSQSSAPTGSSSVSPPPSLSITTSISVTISISLTSTPTPSSTATSIPTKILVGEDPSSTPSLLPSSLPVVTVSASISSSATPIPVQGTIVPVSGNENVIVNGSGASVGSVDFTDNIEGVFAVVTNPTVLPESVRGQRVESTVFDISLFTADGNPVPLESEVEICLEVKGKEFNKDDYCLGFIDEEQKPPVWVCQDSCLRKGRDQQLCGTTDHFTSFALLLGGGSNGGCGVGDSEDFIFDTQWKDYLLIAVVSVAIIACLLIAAVLLSLLPCGQRLIHGTEGQRVRQLPRSSDAHTALLVDAV